MDHSEHEELIAAGPILREVARQYDDVRSRWMVGVLEEGIGALVFMETTAPGSQIHREGDFWSLPALRRFLREEDLCDEFVYRWLTGCEEKATIPVVVYRHFRHSMEGESQLSFYTVCRPTS